MGGDDALVERGFALASAAERWDAALRFARMAEERAQGDGARCAAMLRVAQVLRDRLRDSVAAREQALRAHDRYPLDLRALEVLTALADPDDRTRHTRRSIDAMRESLRGGASRAVLSLQVAEAARLGGDGVLQRAAERLAASLGADFKAPARERARGPRLAA